MSPEQVAGWLRRHRLLAIRHETIHGNPSDDMQAEHRTRIGHWGIHTVLGDSQAGPVS